jgi:hypothetical protein
VVNGIPTTRYEGSYSVADQLKKMPRALRKMTSQSIAALGITRVQFTIWIDGQHQMRRWITVEKGLQHHDHHQAGHHLDQTSR